MSNPWRQNAICQAISMIVDKKIAQADFDKTYKGVISQIVEEASGKYKIKYQDSEIQAYATSSGIRYKEGQLVYFIVPGNDWNKIKTIIGGDNNLATNYNEVQTETDKYSTVGPSFFSFETELCSYRPGIYSIFSPPEKPQVVNEPDPLPEDPTQEQEDKYWEQLKKYNQYVKIYKDVYSKLLKEYTDKKASIDRLIKKYANKGSGLILEMDVRTALDPGQVNGSYGIAFNLEFEGQNNQTVIKSYSISDKDVIGNPYALTKGSTVTALIEDIETSKLKGISSVQVFCGGFPNQNWEKNKEQQEDGSYIETTYIKPNDIFITNIKINSARIYTENELNDYVVNIRYDDGNVLEKIEKQGQVKTIKLQAELRVKGKLITENVSYYWFREDGTVLQGNDYYSAYGGPGWEGLNPMLGAKQFNAKQENDITLTTEWKQAENRQLKYSKYSDDPLVRPIKERVTQIKCVVQYDKRFPEATLQIINENINNNIYIDSSDKRVIDNQTVNKIDYYLDAGSPTLTCVIDDGTEDSQSSKNYKYKWMIFPSNSYEAILKEEQKNLNEILLTLGTKLKAQRAEMSEEAKIEFSNKVLIDFFGSGTGFPKGSYKYYDNAIGLIQETYQLLKHYTPGQDSLMNYYYLFQPNKILQDGQETSGIQTVDRVGTTVQGFIQIAQNIETFERIKGNVYYNFPISSIFNSSRIVCVVTLDDNYIGSASITLKNHMQAQGMYSLNLINGTKVFQYDDKGNSPASVQKEKPIEILPLDFAFIDEEGYQIFHQQIRNNGSITWMIPKQNTLLISDSNKNGDPVNEVTLVGADKALAADYYIYREDTNAATKKLLDNFYYSIENRFDSKKINNNIRLDVIYKDILVTAYTNFTFPKDGDPGTNGTDYVAKLFPYDENNNLLNTERIYISSSGDKYIDTGAKFDKLKFQLYNNGIKVESLNPDQTFWSCPPRVSSDGDNKVTGESYFQVTKQTVEKQSIKQVFGVITKRDIKPPIEKSVDVVRCQYGTGDSLKYFAEYPVCYVGLEDEIYRFKVKPKTGFQYAVYQEDGTSPQYDNTFPFEIIVEKYQLYEKEIKGEKINIDNFAYYLVEDSSQFLFDWDVKGALKPPQGEKDHPQKRWVRPVDSFDSSILYSAIEVTISKKSDKTKIGFIHIPVYMIVNRYGKSYLNDWDGNSIDLGNSQNGVILAPQVGAGKKDDKNTFTGILIGQEKGSKGNKTGLFGYGQGERSIFLDAETGDATFGKNGAGQIKIKAQSGQGTISSGDYPNKYKETTDKEIDSDKTYYIYKDNKYQKVNKPKKEDLKNYYEFVGAGMKIKFSSTGEGTDVGPYIKYGSGNFQVNDEGHITAKGGGQIAGWQINNNRFFKNTAEYEKGKLKLEGTGIFIGMDSNPGSDKAFWAYEKEKGKSAFTQNFYVTKNGFIHSQAGDIAGWQITSDRLSKGDVGISTNDNGAGIRFYAGAIGSDKLRPFYVTKDGFLKSTSGKIATWTIGIDDLTNGKIGLGEKVVNIKTIEKNDADKNQSNVQARIWAGAEQNGKFLCSFAVDKDGNVYANSGRIGGWTLTKEGLKSPKYKVGNVQYGMEMLSTGTLKSANDDWAINSNGTVVFKNGTIGGWTIEENDIYDGKSKNNANVRLSFDSNAKTGKIIAKAGTIGGWTINPNYLSADKGKIVINSSGSIYAGNAESPTWSISSNGDANFKQLSGTLTGSLGMTGSGGISGGGGSWGPSGGTMGSMSFNDDGSSLNQKKTKIGTTKIEDYIINKAKTVVAEIIDTTNMVVTNLTINGNVTVTSGSTRASGDSGSVSFQYLKPNNEVGSLNLSFLKGICYSVSYS